MLNACPLLCVQDDSTGPNSSSPSELETARTPNCFTEETGESGLEENGNEALPRSNSEASSGAHGAVVVHRPSDSHRSTIE